MLLRVKTPGPAAPRDVVVTPIARGASGDLRYASGSTRGGWPSRRRAKAEIGYVHLRAMGGDDYREWARDFYPVFNRQGLIIDVRNNRAATSTAGSSASCCARPGSTGSRASGRPDWNMQYAFRGHVVVLCDERTASDGEAFTEGFRRLGLGKVIGTRTWGGEIWLSSSNILVDRGIATAAEIGVYGPEGSG